MAIHLEPILPKKPIIKIKEGSVEAALRDFGVNTKLRVETYPPPRPTSKRKGRLGKSWAMEGPRKEGNTLLVKVGTNVEYAPQVEGFKTKAPKQTALFAGYGWPSLETVANEEWKKIRLRIEKALAGKE